MKDYMAENPKFSESVKIIETTDAGHADNVNVSTEQLLQNTLVNKKGLDDKVNKDGDVSNTIATFSQAGSRENIKSGEKLTGIFGKILKMFSDMKNAAFYSVINNLLTTQTGVGVLDAYQGKVLKDLYDTLNRNVTELNKNIIFRSGTRTIKANTTGAWYRLGHAEKVSSFYGEFLVWHQWTSNPSTMSKLIVGVNTSNSPSSMIKEIFCTCMDTTQSPRNKNSLIQKARAVYYPAGSWNYDIAIDVFIKSSGAWVQGDNQWWYTLSREMHPQSLNCKWVDDAFGTAGVSSPYVTQEFSFV